MSNKAITYVLDNSKAKGSARVLMIVIADLANDDGECYPGKANLSKKVNVSERQLTTLIRQCEMAGELRVYQRSHSAEDHRTNKYYIVGLYDEKRVTKVREAKPPKARAFPKVEAPKTKRQRKLVAFGGHEKSASGGHEKSASGVLAEGHRKSASDNPLLTPLTNHPKEAAKKDGGDTSRGKPGSYAALHPEIPMEELDKQSAELMKEGVKPSPLSKRALKAAIVKVREYDPERLTSLLNGRIGKAVKDLHSIKFSAEDIPALHKYILAKGFPSFTEAAFAAYAPEFLAQCTNAAAQTNDSNFGAPNWQPDFWDTFDGKVGA